MKSSIIKRRNKPNTIQQVLDELQQLVNKKGEEYAHKSEDRYRNFNQGALLQGEIPEQTLLGYVNKQIVSLFDAKNIIPERLKDVHFVNEKAGDIALYMILLIAMVRDNHGK